MRVYVSLAAAQSDEETPVPRWALELIEILQRKGCEISLGTGYELGDRWLHKMTKFDALLAVVDEHWWSCAAKREQVFEAIQHGLPISMVQPSEARDRGERLGWQINVLDVASSRIPESLTLPVIPLEKRLEMAHTSLVGLSVGDAFGESFFGLTEEVRRRVTEREIPLAPWRWTDDTAQARCVLSCLRLHGEIRCDTLAQLLAEEYSREPNRGYGQGIHSFMQTFRFTSWEKASRSAFNGLGSFGNGAAMRVAPIGAFFSRDIGRAASQARASARITHWHQEGQTGAEAIALGAAWAASGWGGGEGMLEWIRDLLGDGRVRDGLTTALTIPREAGPEKAATLLGSGQEVAAWDTVPFALWCAAHYYDNFTEAMWATVAGLGDRDTTCAMVGGIVALSAPDGVPEEWVQAREPL